MWDKIKKILSKQGEKCIIIEDNKPSYLVMKLEDSEAGAESSETEEINKSIDELKPQEEVELNDNKGIEIEDLPF
ncbi:MAG: hypothetical protein ISS02_00295 [Candidatus Portnoybacteria bacterium]|nr:hypothetical protein [Candidatus Portnoybacteria bacterium]